MRVPATLLPLSMGLTGFEPVTSRLSSVRSNQLSYKPSHGLFWPWGQVYPRLVYNASTRTRVVVPSPMRCTVLMIAAVVLRLGTGVCTPCAQAGPLAPPGGLTERQPSKGLQDATPLTTYVATSAVRGLDEGGEQVDEFLKYTWSLPEGFDGSARDVVIILPGTGLDHRWGPRVYEHATWRPGDIVISIDGTRELVVGGRTFGKDARDATIFRDATLEIIRAFPTRRIYLYGHNEGAFFTLLAATSFPRLYNGIVVHGGGLWNSTRVGPSPRGVPICFLHGTEDQVAPYLWAVDARDELVKNGFRIVGLRRVYGHKHEPEPGEASACIDFVMGMTTDKPEEAIELARRMLSSQNGRTPMFGLADAVLARLELSADKEAWPRGFKEISEDAKREGAGVRLQIQTLGLRHAGALRAQIKDAQGLRQPLLEMDTPTPAWIGHLLAAREDWRGVEAIEALAADLKLDEVLAEHDAAARVLMEALATQEPKDALAVIRQQIGKCALFEPLPKNLLAIIEAWADEAEMLKLKPEDVQATVLVRQLLTARLRGLEAYRQLNASWAPDAPNAVPAARPAAGP